MNNQKTRLNKLLILTAVILGVGLAYYLFIRLTGIMMPCVIHKFTGLYCITCGITRMFVSLFSLDFSAAAQNNLLVFSLLVPAIIFAIYKAVKYVKTGEKQLTKPQKIIILLMLLLSVVFMVLRNLPQLSFLAPI